MRKIDVSQKYARSTLPSNLTVRVCVLYLALLCHYIAADACGPALPFPHALMNRRLLTLGTSGNPQSESNTLAISLQNVFGF